MNSLVIKGFKYFLTCFSLIFLSSNVMADTYPSKPIRLIVPFPPGGPTDIVARPLAILLGDRLKGQIVIENKGGAGGSIGADLVAKSLPDGYTLFMGTVGTNAINGSLYKQLPYDMTRDFTPIALVATAPVVIVVNSSDRIKTLAELIAEARSKPDTIAYGTAGNGTPGHLTAALFESTTQIKLKHIPYKGSAPAVTDLIGNQIPLVFDPIQSVLPHISSGKLRALAVTSKTRSPLLPNVPTVAELGYPQFESTAWWALFGPAKLPDSITKKLRVDTERVAQSAAFKERLGNLGVQPNTDFKESLANFQTSEIAKWARVVRDSGATID
ncbi:tripartite tricarboxylate transporter substrate binding protein [Polynucleobacter paneuropaeus]|jgi:tripartite-type tricarboxylate transporter receptor subunit TctC|nr:tripartite tricarboxylate transporter substrate binding protein [Polynucleobacter paneuropaeus]MBT8566530.1 tripartite tricarboxylate transporter substrate binding protein [Polynucleobacter paneuropaeus]MBT8575839.1 tripartite tricarboxylate transporter substrate binding protein [Polynucleobacter paneuropaeus]MBT8631710.1 tripartite tricarboxylate transporter substrate binding protein [Polynucleobacter paneuropaeus]QWD16730.1 tripartite tricarboxylate transporter substrate binding protein [P